MHRVYRCTQYLLHLESTTKRYSCTDPNWRDSPHELSNSPNHAKFIVAQCNAHTVSAAAEIENKTDERSMSCSASAVGGLVGQLVQDKC